MTTVNPSEPAVPAGWYRDPLGIPQLRWWNGVGWTNRIQEDRTEFNSSSADFTQVMGSGRGRHSSVA